VVTINAPADYPTLVAPLPGAVLFIQKAAVGADFVHLFISGRKALEKELKRLRKLIADTGVLFIVENAAGDATARLARFETYP